MARQRVIIAMSGGVDSSVAAALLADEGLDVVGVTLHLWDTPDDGSVRGRCCAPEDQHDARRVADHLGISHYAFDRRAEFRREVVTPFVDAYLGGETPSPCVACNRGPKLRELFDLADDLGAELVATGHYARLGRDDVGPCLLRARDGSKDQSYFLHALGREQLSRLRLPLGSLTKPEVREIARARGLPGAAKGESQELCFVPSGRYDAFVDARAAGRARPGPILDGSGAVVGRHAGVHGFTIGQRRGLGVSLGKPAFVVDLDGATGAVQLGDEAALGATRLTAVDGRFLEGAPRELVATVRVRARHEGERARVTIDPSGAMQADFERPVRAVARGQYAVVYDGDRVLGGARITSTERPS